jgi:hypothetical protein
MRQDRSKTFRRNHKEFNRIKKGPQQGVLSEIQSQNVQLWLLWATGTHSGGSGLCLSASPLGWICRSLYSFFSPSYGRAFSEVSSSSVPAGCYCSPFIFQVIFWNSFPIPTLHSSFIWQGELLVNRWVDGPWSHFLSSCEMAKHCPLTTTESEPALTDPGVVPRLLPTGILLKLPPKGCFSLNMSK